MWSWPVCSGPANFATSYSAVTPQPGTSPMSRNSAFGAGFVIAGQTQEIFNDIGGVAVAYTNVLKVLAHSWAALVAGHYIPPRTQRTWSGYVVMGPSELASPSPKATYQA